MFKFIQRLFTVDVSHDPRIEQLKYLGRRPIKKQWWVHPNARMDKRLLTFSRDIVQLIQWMRDAEYILRQEQYVDIRWSSANRVLLEKSLDDYLTDDKYDIDLIASWDNILATCISYTKAMDDIDEEHQLYGYYRRQYRAIEHDLNNLVIMLLP